MLVTSSSDIADGRGRLVPRGQLAQKFNLFSHHLFP